MNPIFSMLQNPSKSIEREMSAVRLSPEEVFLEAMDQVDYALEDPVTANIDFMGLYDQLFCDIRDLCPQELDENEVALAASEIIFVVSLLLTMTDRHTYRKMAMTLLGQISRDVYSRLHQTFEPYIIRMGEDKIKKFLKDYLVSDNFLSDEIKECIGNLPRIVKLPSSTPSSTERKSHIRIAARKKTSVVIVLNAMYKAGWFVDEEGKKLRNRDDALNEILMNAFGVDRQTAVSQTINPSANTDSRKQEKVISDLLDGKDAEIILEEIREELLRNAK